MNIYKGIHTTILDDLHYLDAKLFLKRSGFVNEVGKIWVKDSFHVTLPDPPYWDEYCPEYEQGLVDLLWDLADYYQICPIQVVYQIKGDQGEIQLT